MYDFFYRKVTPWIGDKWSHQDKTSCLCESTRIFLPDRDLYNVSPSRKSECRTQKLSRISWRVEYIFLIRSYDHTIITDQGKSRKRADRSRQYRTRTRSYREWRSNSFSGCSIYGGKCQKNRDERTEREEWFHARNYGTFICKSDDFAKRENERSEIENIFYTRAYYRIANYEQLPSYEETNILSKRESVFVKL